MTSGACPGPRRTYSRGMCTGRCYETRHAAGDALAPHRHVHAYAALVVEGGHVESSIDGPIACEPGTLLLHPRFHAHGNRFGDRGARVLNLVLDNATADMALAAHARACRVADLRDARAVFAHGATHRLRALVDDAAPQPSTAGGWQSAFLRALGESDAPVAQIARRLGVSSAHASRALLRSHGMGPQALRRELRWRRALSLLQGDRALAEVAALAGFADQSHLTRVARSCSGRTPSQLRREVKSVQDGRQRPVA